MTQFKKEHKIFIIVFLVSTTLLSGLLYYFHEFTFPRSVSVLPAPLTTPLPTTILGQIDKDKEGWKMYRNERYGYQLFYPPDWKMWGVEFSEELGTTTGEEWGVSLKASGDRNRSLDVSVWSGDKKEPFIIDGEGGVIKGTLREREKWQILFRKELEIGGIKTTLYTAKFYKDCEDYFARIPRNDYVYWFNAFCDDGTGRPHELVTQILASFKFFEPARQKE
ncbi:MAG: hypothetical protein A2945_01215 [Candidatus Liptonbacteria bacterium RIFCSPLOWO2_01_FULL_52_25]|uniref:Uncharacterized protein n=1 Tax=Candidatus Liptonbacteria bacterium RIFCSPLOWO2_01_FULL_52_25 TaxID=1798650 RepID=A0A1G2CFD6_9BACT|nr:MAG: hypothetical protein A2945_01215 [Candidatus Liptonbacteria bacterium RIFCSPLOWO2_01_FULL_52_25]